MSFTNMWNKEWKGKDVLVYLSNRRRYYGKLEDFGDTFVNIDGVMFNPEFIISMSVCECKVHRNKR